MNLPQFTTSTVCLSGDHCSTCRDREKGARFRAGLRGAFSIPEADFPCPYGKPWSDVAPPAPPAPAKASIGPGTALKQLLAKLGIAGHQGCGCTDFANQMDAWGADECEKRMDEVVGNLIRQRANLHTSEWPGIMAKVVTSGLVFKVNPLDPVRSLVSLAIANARAST